MKNHIVIDTNMFILLIIGLINKERISTISKRTKMYTEDDFNFLIEYIPSDFKNIVTNPNIWAEVDNLLNNSLSGEYKLKYIEIIKKIVMYSEEVYSETKEALKYNFFYDIGLTDSIILNLAKNCKIFISDDSKLCDYAKSMNINVLDMKEYLNYRLNI